MLAFILVDMRFASCSFECKIAHPTPLKFTLGCTLCLLPAFMFGLSLIIPISALVRQALVLQVAALSAIAVLSDCTIRTGRYCSSWPADGVALFLPS